MSNYKHYLSKSCLVGLMLAASINTYSQITLNVSSTSVKSVINKIENQSDYRFFFEDNLPGLTKKVNINVKDKSINYVLDEVCSQAGISYTIKGNNQVVIHEAKPAVSQQSVTKTIKGVVVDASGMPIIGANIMVKGTTNGTITDIDGNFTLNNIESNAVLAVSYIGYSNQEVKVGNKTNFSITLKEDTKTLDEVVVISYGTQKKRDLTGSITKISANNLSDIPVAQFAQKLQGQIPGVQINQTSGLPGQGMAFRIRGAASINAGNSPLFVIDGMPISSPLNNINPDEIESFSILKDASATSLYGSRAANGVVLITTKGAKAGSTNISLNVSYGIQTIPMNKKLKLMNAKEFAQYQKERYEDKIKYENYNGDIPFEYQNPEKYGTGTDWFKTLTRTSPIQNYSLNISTGKEKFTSAIILGYFKQDGVLYNTSFERFNLRANNKFQANDKLSFGLNIAPSIQIYKNQGTDGYRNIIGAAMCASPILSPYNEDGTWRPNLTAPDMFPQPNWLQVLKEKIDIHKVISLIGNANADLDIWNGIKYKFQLGFDIESRNQRAFSSSKVGGDAYSAPPQKAIGSFNTGFHYTWNIENLLTYNKRISKHNIDALVGYSAQKYTNEGNYLNGTDFPDDDITWISAAATTNGKSNMEQWAIISLIGRFNYSFNDKYLLLATFRRDGCSRFGKKNRYANFPSISAGWIISDEPFMRKINNVMNYLKIRLSYGLTGNYNIGNYSYFSNVNTANYTFNNTLASGKYLSTLGNENLTWEENKQFDLGIDIGFLNDRFFLQYDYYRKKTNNMLYQIDIPAASGYWNVQANTGDIKSWGHEIMLTSKNLINNFKWNTSLNISINKNKVTRLGTNNTPIGGYADRADFNRLQVGKPIGVFMGYVFDGVYMTSEEYNTQPKHITSDIGTVRMKDIDGNGIIDANDRTVIGNPNPDFTFGLNNDFSYKKFDLSINLAGQVGGDVIMWAHENHYNIDGVFNVYKSVSNRWRSLDNPGNGKVPRTKTGTTGLFFMTNSSWVYNASYIAIKNITLGYTIPFKANPYISKIRFYLSGQQLAVFSSYPGMNPEASSSLNWNGLGVDATTYPIPRTFSLGCNITF